MYSEQTFLNKQTSRARCWSGFIDPDTIVITATPASLLFVVGKFDASWYLVVGTKHVFMVGNFEVGKSLRTRFVDAYKDVSGNVQFCTLKEMEARGL